MLSYGKEESKYLKILYYSIMFFREERDKIALQLASSQAENMRLKGG